MTAKDKNALDATGIKVLKTLAAAGDPRAPKQIAEAAGLDGKVVSDQIKGLKALGLVDSPVRCKYAITAAGKDRIAG
jgi:predicted transcriptional regulator